MNFLRYDVSNGAITSVGYMPDRFVQQEIDAGNPVLFIDQDYDYLFWRVNLQTKELEVIPPTGNAKGQANAMATALIA